VAACGRKRPDARNSIACAALSQRSGPADLGIRDADVVVQVLHVLGFFHLAK
jgi:hypothetical protein